MSWEGLGILLNHTISVREGAEFMKMKNTALIPSSKFWKTTKFSFVEIFGLCPNVCSYKPLPPPPTTQYK